MLGDSGWRERSAERYVRVVGHATENFLLHDDGTATATFALRGTPFELEEFADRNSRHFGRNTLYRSIADDNVTLVSHFVRHDEVPELPAARFRSSFARELDHQYRERVLRGRLRMNEWFLTIAVSPRAALGKWASARLKKIAKTLRKDVPAASDAVLHILADLVSILTRGMADYAPRLLGLREEDGVLFSEPAEALHLALYGRYAPVPLVHGHLGSAIYTDRIICGLRGIEVRALGRPYFGVIMGLREYPAPTTRLGMLNPVLGLDCPLVLTQSFECRTRAQTQAALSLKHAQLESAQDAAESQREALIRAKDDVANNAYVTGSHHLSLALYGETLDAARESAAKAKAALTGAGAVFVEESLGCEAAVFSQLPCNREWRTRPGVVSSRNFSALSTFDNYPNGASGGHWGAPLIRFRTRGGTHYDYHLHVHGVGHTAIFGPTGGGKTTFLLFLLAMLESAMVDRPGSIVLFDKDAGGEIMVRAAGGSYLTLRKGEASGLAPLKALEDTPQAQGFLQKWITALIRIDGGPPLIPEEDDRLKRGIRRQLRLPRGLRSFGGLREFLGHADPAGAGARLEKWCHGGALGWAFDNDADEIDLNRPIVGFDMGKVLGDEMLASPMATYILHRIESLLDGRRFVMAADEFWRYLANELFEAVFDDFLLTLRKGNGSLILCTQQPEHALFYPDGRPRRLGASLVAQCMTKILFPNSRARRDAYGDQGLGCTPAIYQAVREDLLNTRSFVLMRDSGSVICDFDLSAMPAQVATLSGTRNRSKLLDDIRREVGDDPARFVPEYQRRYAEAVD